MTAALHLLFLFIAKMLDNAFSTMKTILVQRNHPILAGLSLAVSSYLYLITVSYTHLTLPTIRLV